MRLAEYLSVLRKHWTVIALSTIAGVALASVLSAATTPLYRAESQVFVSTRSGDSLNDLVAGNSFTVNQVSSYTALVSSPRVLQPVIDELGLGDSADSLAERVTAESPEETVLITIAVSDPDPQLAARTADTIASSLATVVSDLEGPSGDEGSPVRISTVREAQVPASPVTPRTALNVVLGLVLGLLVGVGIAVLRSTLDTRVRSEEDVPGLTDAALLGTIALDDEAAGQPLILQGSPQSRRAESFRRLRTNLQFVEVDDNRRHVLVTSSLPGEGKSTTAINLAITLADAGTRVVLVDGDLRRPSVSRYLGLEGSVGLTTALIGRVPLEAAVQPWGDTNLFVLPSGEVPPNPSELLGSAQMERLVAKLDEMYDVVVIDSAPLLPVTDSAVLARLTGGTILVIRAGEVHNAQVQQAIRALSTVGVGLHGVVLNGVAQSDASEYRYQYYEPDSVPVADDGRPGSRVLHGAHSYEPTS
ncbi:polysaccharide biosynthesis tyrosine autokinase [Isoptericola sp. NEAU-Y5]|uniref:Polysaccharide biosynthesis tyrosine autokinase n=1 Tax=Isoptericola luteus TaxID=2879484 RepID=A0ABS7ZFB6_9MICO|nr:polysaccharide biosynthesis tyrosine autokinase [Isoptericola sp. NEAU-Y5]MCA5893001.1 polysaccharide biosynthesis tyrosine autokinase [Isoptericola sp. NEAU-Y5]